ncbi:hypothetical protein IPJ70_02790 [Candidatus Campbellbacteria bacterium]|nr:MAG: hypothetical protein IPJ70_02790 [Candidatus Campbellbacteria bacterium]
MKKHTWTKKQTQSASVINYGKKYVGEPAFLKLLGTVKGKKVLELGSGNGWFANESEAGIVEVSDANGKSLSNKEILKATTDWLVLPTQFSAVVGDRQMMSYIQTDTGVIRITSKGAKNGETTQTIEIPVRFR